MATDRIPEIDRLPRIEIRTLRPMFRKAKELLSDERNRNRGGWLSMRLSGGDIEVIVNYYPKELSLLFDWSYQGMRRTQKIELTEVESNLGLTPFLNFVCPYTGETCRKLFTDWEKWCGRKAFKHTYSVRNDSKSLRIYAQIGNYKVKLDKDLSRAKYRKDIYRGRFTQNFESRLRRLNKYRSLLRTLDYQLQQRQLRQEAMIEEWERNHNGKGECLSKK